MKHICKHCVFGLFRRSDKTGRVLHSLPGDCSVSIPCETIPICVPKKPLNRKKIWYCSDEECDLWGEK